MSVKANVRSPYYLKFTDPNLTRVSLDLYIYSGIVTADKGNRLYNLTNDVISNTDYVVFEVSDFVRDHISHSFNGIYNTTPYWFTAEATLYNGTEVIREEIVDRLAFDGYTGFADGVNSEGTRDELITTKTIRIPEGQVYRLPIFSEEVYTVTEYVPAVTGAVAAARWNDEAREWQVNQDYWDNQASQDQVVISNIDQSSTNKVQYMTIESNVKRVTITNSDNTYDIINTEDCISKYGWNKLTFINKHGALQDFYCTGKREDNVQYESSNFKSSSIDFSAMSYDTAGGQSKRFNVGSRASFVLNTGFIHEDEISALEELIMSENIWVTEESGRVFKVNTLDTSLIKQNHLNDKLINVSLNFEFAFDNINTVI